MKMARFAILMALLIALASCTPTTTTTIEKTWVGARLQYAVTLDGQISSSSEWSDTSSVDYNFGLGIPPGSPFVAARIWAKNDDTWLYLLYRIEWPSADIDPTDGAQIARFWGQYVPPWEYSDLGHVSFNASTWDAYGWDDTQWYSDTDHSGENNVEGAAMYDGTYYWFEFRKKLNSGDGHDWSFAPGDIYYNQLLAGLWDNSISSEYHAYIELHLF